MTDAKQQVKSLNNVVVPYKIIAAKRNTNNKIIKNNNIIFFSLKNLVTLHYLFQ